MGQTTRHYKAAPPKQLRGHLAAAVVWLIAAMLVGWAVSLALAWFGDREAAKLPAWTPPTISMELKPRQSTQSATPVNVGNVPWQLVGIADDRIYVRSEGKPASFAEGDSLPNGDVVKKIERDSVVVSSKGGDNRISLYRELGAIASRSTGEAVASSTPRSSACRLSTQDRSIATFLEPAVATALMKEASTFNRIFTPLVAVGSDGGVRATGTGGITAAFGIQDGDTLFRAEGRAITSGQSVLNEVMARIQRGETVVVEGERSGAQRRWVFAPSSCRS